MKGHHRKCKISMFFAFDYEIMNFFILNYANVHNFCKPNNKH